MAKAAKAKSILTGKSLQFLRDYISNPADFASQAAFLSYFRGIVLVDSADGPGSILTLEPGSNFNRLTLYYGSGTGEYEFVLDNNSSRFNWFRHVYNPDLTDTLNDPNFRPHVNFRPTSLQYLLHSSCGNFFLQ